jgi:hypothetical protein
LSPPERIAHVLNGQPSTDWQGVDQACSRPIACATGVNDGKGKRWRPAPHTSTEAKSSARCSRRHDVQANRHARGEHRRISDPVISVLDHVGDADDALGEFWAREARRLKYDEASLSLEMFSQKDGARVQSVEEEDIRNSQHVNQFPRSVNSERSASWEDTPAGEAPEEVLVARLGDPMNQARSGRSSIEAHVVDRDIGLLEVASDASAS